MRSSRVPKSEKGQQALHLRLTAKSEAQSTLREEGCHWTLSRGSGAQHRRLGIRVPCGSALYVSAGDLGAHKFHTWGSSSYALYMPLDP